MVKLEVLSVKGLRCGGILFWMMAGSYKGVLLLLRLLKRGIMILYKYEKCQKQVDYAEST